MHIKIANSKNAARQKSRFAPFCGVLRLFAGVLRLFCVLVWGWIFSIWALQIKFLPQSVEPKHCRVASKTCNEVTCSKPCAENSLGSLPHAMCQALQYPNVDIDTPRSGNNRAMYHPEAAIKRSAHQSFWGHGFSVASSAMADLGRMPPPS